MVCPRCKEKLTVLDTVVNEDDHEVYRHRVCRNQRCKHKFYTVEFEVEPNEQFKRNWVTYHR